MLSKNFVFEICAEGHSAVSFKTVYDTSHAVASFLHRNRFQVGSEFSLFHCASSTSENVSRLAQGCRLYGVAESLDVGASFPRRCHERRRTHRHQLFIYRMWVLSALPDISLFFIHLRELVLGKRNKQPYIYTRQGLH